MSAPSIRMDGSLRLRSLEAAADCGAFIELEAERDGGIAELTEWLRLDEQRLSARARFTGSYARWRALRAVVEELALEYAKSGELTLTHQHAGKIRIRGGRRARDWFGDFDKTLDEIKRSFGGARLDDGQLRIHLERSAGRLTLPPMDTEALLRRWETSHGPDAEVLLVQNRFSELEPILRGRGADQTVAHVLVCPPGTGRGYRAPFKLARAPVRGFQTGSSLRERSSATATFAAAYLLGRGVAYELRREGVEVVFADADDPMLRQLR